MPAPIDFAQLFDRSPNPYMLLDRELRYVAANQAYLNVTASRLEDLLGRHVLDAFPNDPTDPNNASARMLRASFERVLATRAPDVLALVAYRVPRRTGAGEVVDEERFWSATHTPLLDARGEVAFILQHTEDVTELQQLKRAAEATGAAPGQREAGVLERARRVQEANGSLDAERLHLRRLFEQAPGFMAFLRGPTHVFELANRAYFQVVGHRELLGKPMREALPELTGQGFYELLDRVYATAEPFVGRGAAVLLQRHPGAAPLEERFVDFVYQPILAPDGSVAGIFVQGHDITEQRRAEQELRRYREHLEDLVRERTRALEESEAERRRAEASLLHAQKLEAVGQLTGGVAHDFNNLLQVIGGNLQLLLHDVRGSDVARRRVQVAVGAVERGARLASHLLAFARRQPLAPAALDVRRLLEGLDELLRRALGERIALETRAAAGLWNTYADPGQLENVLLNLALNARDAMDGEGTLTVEADNAVLAHDDARRPADVPAGEYVRFAVRDTGSGMAPEVLARIFEPFFTTKAGKGTGLGLSMVYGFVKQSGGHVAVQSAPGEGTTLELFLPRAHGAALPLAEPAEGPVVGGRETVLVVEDDPGVRGTAVELLAGLGYRVLEAADAQGALALLEAGAAVDLLFTDVVMPGPLRSGALARRARALLPGLQVLFTSGYAEEEIVHGGRLDPGVHLLPKPYRREDLARRVRQLLDSGVPGPTRVLVVEDDPHIRESAVDLLELMGHRVRAVASAEEAHEALRAGLFDVLLTDVSLPGKSGLVLAREARLAHPALRVIVSSGHDRPPRGEAPAEGAVVLPKPYGREQLERALAGA